MKLTSISSIVTCALSFLAGLAFAGGLARAPSPPPAGAAWASLCDGRDVAESSRRVEARDVTLPDGRVARVVMVDEGTWE